MHSALLSVLYSLSVASLAIAAPYNGTIAKRFGENCDNVVYANLEKVLKGVNCGGQVIESSWIKDTALGTLNSLNENYYPGNPDLKTYPADFKRHPAYYVEIDANCAASLRVHEEPIVVGGGRWYDLATANPNADPSAYRLVSGFYGTDTSDPCTAYLTYCGVVWHDEEDTNHLAPCEVIR